MQHVGQFLDPTKRRRDVLIVEQAIEEPDLSRREHITAHVGPETILTLADQIRETLHLDLDLSIRRLRSPQSVHRRLMSEACFELSRAEVPWLDPKGPRVLPKGRQVRGPRGPLHEERIHLVLDLGELTELILDLGPHGTDHPLDAREDIVRIGISISHLRLNLFIPQLQELREHLVKLEPLRGMFLGQILLVRAHAELCDRLVGGSVAHAGECRAGLRVAPACLHDQRDRTVPAVLGKELEDHDHAGDEGQDLPGARAPTSDVPIRVLLLEHVENLGLHQDAIVDLDGLTLAVALDERRHGHGVDLVDLNLEVSSLRSDEPSRRTLMSSDETLGLGVVIVEASLECCHLGHGSSVQLTRSSTTSRRTTFATQIRMCFLGVSVDVGLNPSRLGGTKRDELVERALTICGVNRDRPNARRSRAVGTAHICDGAVTDIADLLVLDLHQLLLDLSLEHETLQRRVQDEYGRQEDGDTQDEHAPLLNEDHGARRPTHTLERVVHVEEDEHSLEVELHRCADEGEGKCNEESPVRGEDHAPHERPRDVIEHEHPEKDDGEDVLHRDFGTRDVSTPVVQELEGVGLEIGQLGHPPEFTDEVDEELHHVPKHERSDDHD